jgi:hypothetical protein
LPGMCGEASFTMNEGNIMKDLRCLVGWHHFVTLRSEDGTGVTADCSRCGKYNPDFRVASPQ